MVLSKLGLQVYDDFNCKVMRVMDISTYNQSLDKVECGRLLITVPGFGYPILHDVEPGFNRSFNAIDLTLQGGFNYADTADLPDGIYTLNYSIAPNDQVYVEYNYLRQCQAYCLYYGRVCALDLNPCNMCGDRKEKIDKLQEIKFILEAAKAYAEECNAPIKGLELQNYAVSLLKDMDIGCSSCDTCK